MAVFAVTGNLASGKSTLVGLLKERGAVVFDSDKAVHRYYRDRRSRVYRGVSKSFPQALGRDKKILRSRLAEIVFGDARALRRLERIVHPWVIKDLKQWIKKAAGSRRIFAAEVPLLFEKKLEGLFAGIILVVTSRERALARAKKSGLSGEEAKKRLSFYISPRAKMSQADFVIYNNSNRRILKREVNLLWGKLKNIN